MKNLASLVIVIILIIMPQAIVGLWRVYIVFLDTSDVVKEWSKKSIMDILTTLPATSVFWMIQGFVILLAVVVIFWDKIQKSYQNHMISFGDVVDQAREENVSWWHIPITVKRTRRLCKVRAYFPGVDPDGPGAIMSWQSTAGREQFGVKEMTLRPGRKYNIPFIAQFRPRPYTNFDGSAYLTPDTNKSWDEPQRDHIPLGDIRPITVVVESGDGRFRATQTYQVNVPNNDNEPNNHIRIDKISS